MGARTDEEDSAGRSSTDFQGPFGGATALGSLLHHDAAGLHCVPELPPSVSGKSHKKSPSAAAPEPRRRNKIEFRAAIGFTCGC
ncbi:hypothetical protein L1887_62869 [Cichorium endivia]|nr:hypothetical protein L1887_62869 [Cichorium endivia]